MQRLRLAAGCALAALLADAPVFGNEVSYTSGVTLTLTPWSQPVLLQRFDPALGSLQQVRIELRNTIRGRVGYENLNAAPATSVIQFQGALNLGGPTGFSMATLATTPVAIQTQAFDGANDQGGSSGGLIANLFAQQSTFASPNANQTPAFVGTGTLGVQVGASNTTALSSGNPLSFSSRVTLDAQITVTYTFIPPADCDHDGTPDASEPDSDGDGLPDDCDTSSAGYSRPGSLLVYPEFDGSPGAVTIITVTNHRSTSPNVRVRFVYIDSSNCLQFDRTEELLPQDTFSAVTSAHNTFFPRGYVFVYAVDLLGRPIAHDFLSGATLRFDGLSTYAYSVNAIPFKAGPGLTLTDVDGDGLRDLNGIEYERAPDELLFTRFLGTSASREADLVLLNLSGGGPFQCLVNVLVWNDNAEVFSAQTSFHCWGKQTLSSISSVFTNSFLHNLSNDDPNEILGAPAEESGWFKLDGLVSGSSNIQIPDPAILAVLIERTNPSDFATEMPFYLGEQANGDLVITSPNGDTSGD